MNYTPLNTYPGDEREDFDQWEYRDVPDTPCFVRPEVLNQLLFERKEAIRQRDEVRDMIAKLIKSNSNLVDMAGKLLADKLSSTKP